MAYKQFTIDDSTIVTIYKCKNSRSLRLSINSKGEIKVSIPYWASYASGLAFAKSKYAWIEQKKKPVRVLEQGRLIGKAHHLNFIADPLIKKPSTRIVSSEIIVRYPSQYTIKSPSVQKAAETAGIRALRVQAENLLPQRLKSLALKHGFEYRSVSIKLLKSRWGSCDQDKRIVLNLYLMQLPWDFIDYVLLHELIHTRVLKHGPEFWSEFLKILPDAKQIRRKMHTYQPLLSS